MNNARFILGGAEHLAYSFESFSVGPSNVLAFETFFQIAEQWPRISSPPLFLTGDTGLGKTHLNVALLRRLRDKSPHANLSWVSAERFAIAMADATRMGKLDLFRSEYQKLDALFLEAVHFLDSNQDAQAEAVRAFTALSQCGKLVVIDSDVHAAQATSLIAPMRAFLQSARHISVGHPDLEERRKIARIKLRALFCDDGDYEELGEFLAVHCQRNVRELEGAIHRLAAFCKLMGLPISVETASKCLLNFK